MTTLDPSASSPAQVLTEQLSLIWTFADEHVLSQVDLEVATWEPTANSVGVHRRQGCWVADWPDESTSPLPEPTVGWLLWHIEWWWGNAIRACQGGTLIGPEAHLWSGSVEGVRSAKAAWDEVLRATPADAVVTGLMPEDSPLWFVAGWVNFELTKNVAEIGQLLLRHANR